MRLPIRSRRSVLAGLAALPVAARVGSRQVRADDFTAIRYLTSLGNVTSFEVAGALGWLRDKNLRIDSVGSTQGGPESLVALASGGVDLAGAATPAIINAIAGGAKILSVMPGNGVSEQAHSKFFVLDGSSLRGAADLKDKSIAVNTLGAHLDYVTREYLRRNGLPEDAANLITAPGPQLEQILRHRQADIVAVGAWQSVFAGKIEEGGGVRVLFTDYAVLGPIVLGMVAMKKDFIAGHPQLVKDFVTVCAKAVDWTGEHPEDAKKLVAQILKERGENPELAKYWPGYGLRAHALYVENDTRFWLDVLVRTGKLKPGQFTPEDIATNRYNDLARLAQR